EAAPALLRFLALLEGPAQAAPGVALVGLDIEELPVELDREVEVAPAHRLVRFLELLRAVHGRRCGPQILGAARGTVNATRAARRESRRLGLGWLSATVTHDARDPRVRSRPLPRPGAPQGLGPGRGIRRGPALRRRRDVRADAQEQGRRARGAAGRPAPAHPRPEPDRRGR